MTVDLASSTVSKWLYTVLDTDFTYPVWEEPAPAEAIFPRIVYSQSSGTHIQGHNAIEIMYDGIWLVKAIDRKQSFVTLNPIAKRIHELLHRTSGTVDSGIVLSSRATETIRYSEVSNGINYRHLGFLFSIGAQ